MPAGDPEKRPDPDALLALSQRERPGRLKIFLGAAPGVGKTCAMLQEAHRLRAEGRDVVLGLIETHGRAETEALAAGLETLPRRQIDYRGQRLEEFDIDAALARRPALLVVDELAHTNAPQSRHPKRWQDIRELLDAGIDVWTALNIQHLESLADVVAQVTGVTVRETVPDVMVQDAQDVVLVDIPPDELIARLKAGKVYLPQTARRAVEKFFTPGNLTALRELALRRTAERVDDQMTEILRQKAIEGPWASAERLLLCLFPDGSSDTLIRQTARLASALNADWIALLLAPPGDPADASATEQNATEALRLVETLGGVALRLTSADFAEDILRVARRENVSQILLGHRTRGPLARLLRQSLPEALTARATGIAVHLLPLPGPQPATARRRLEALRRGIAGPGLPLDLSLAVLATTGVVAIGLALAAVMELPNLSMIFLAGVLICGTFRGTRAAVAAALLSFLAYNFFFIEPRFTFNIGARQGVTTVFLFLVAALVAGHYLRQTRPVGR